MYNCNKCLNEIKSESNFIKCVQCSAYYHPVCTRIASTENFKKMGQRKTIWVCDGCKPGRGKLPKVSDSYYHDFLAELRVMNDSLKNEITDINNKFDVTNKMFAEINVTLSKLSNNVDAIKTENVELKNKYTELKKVNDALNLEITSLSQYSRISNIEISGIPLTKGEDMDTILSMLAKILDVTFKTEDVSPLSIVFFLK